MIIPTWALDIIFGGIMSIYVGIMVTLIITIFRDK